jgi:Ca-activated chloride channel family protein
MTRLSLILMATLMIATARHEAVRGQSQTPSPRTDIPVQGGASVATFKSTVDLVRVSATVRDRRGRFVRDLTASDFSVLDAGIIRRITDFRHDLAGVSIAVLFDVSGSMEARLRLARETGSHLLGWLDRTRDEVAVFAFDTRLTQLTPFTTGLQALPEELDLLTPFGATGLHDAVAQTARRLDDRNGRRRAVVVLTDGVDNASRLSASEVSGIASSIDVPVYVVGIVPSIDNPSAESAVPSATRSALVGSLANLAEWTGGNSFVASTSGERSAASRQIVDELRHQYLIAFESSTRPGWHPLIVRARDKDLTVRARSGYFAGQSRPYSQ